LPGCGIKISRSFKEELEKADQLSPLLVFPFRSEIIAVLEWAGTQSGSWKPKYYLALVLKEKNRTTECDKLFMNLNTVPDYAPFYAARAELMNHDSVQAELDLKRAMQLNPEEWRYHKLLAGHYMTFNENVKALSVAEPYYKKHPGNYIIGCCMQKRYC
jgi:hypothetical protein